MWFNDYVLDKSGQIANPIIAKVDPIPYYSIICARESINCEHSSRLIHVAFLQPTRSIAVWYAVTGQLCVTLYTPFPHFTL